MFGVALLRLYTKHFADIVCGLRYPLIAVFVITIRHVEHLGGQLRSLQMWEMLRFIGLGSRNFYSSQMRKRLVDHHRYFSYSGLCGVGGMKIACID